MDKKYIIYEEYGVAHFGKILLRYWDSKHETNLVLVEDERGESLDVILNNYLSAKSKGNDILNIEINMILQYKKILRDDKIKILLND